MSKKTKKKVHVVSLLVNTSDFNRSVQALSKHVSTKNAVVSEEIGDVTWFFDTERSAKRRENEVRQYLRTKTYNTRLAYGLLRFEQ